MKKEPTLIFYASAFACQLKKFNGKVTLTEFLDILAVGGIDIFTENSEYSEDFKMTITSQVAIINGQKVQRAIFDNGLSFETVNRGFMSSMAIEGKIDKEHMNQLLKNIK